VVSALAVVGFTIAVIPGAVWIYYVVSIRNELIIARNAVDRAWRDTLAELRRRLDLISGLTRFVEAYADHESRLLARFADARRDYARSGGGADVFDPSVRVALHAVAEDHPELRASQTYSHMMAELDDTETRVVEARREYNRVSTKYNNLRQTFPQSLISAAFRMPVPLDMSADARGKAARTDSAFG
jgi:LemA protein